MAICKVGEDKCSCKRQWTLKETQLSNLNGLLLIFSSASKPIAKGISQLLVAAFKPKHGTAKYRCILRIYHLIYVNISYSVGCMFIMCSYYIN